MSEPTKYLDTVFKAPNGSVLFVRSDTRVVVAELTIHGTLKCADAEVAEDLPRRIESYFDDPENDEWLQGYLDDEDDCGCS